MGEVIIAPLETGPNAGSLRSVCLIPTHQVLGLTRPLNGLSLARGGLTLQPSAEMARFELAPGLSGYSVNQVRSDAGVGYGLTVNLMIPRLEVDLLAWLHERADYRWLVLAEDRYDAGWLLGDVATNGLLLNWLGETGNAPGDKNFVRATLTGDMWHPPYSIAERVFGDFF